MNKVLFLLLLLLLLLVLFYGTNHAPGVSVTQVNHSIHTLSTFLRIRADPSMQIFWISVTVALSDTIYHPLLYCTKRTNNHRDHFGFHLSHFLYF